MTMTMLHGGGETITSRHNSQAAVNYRVRSALVPAAFEESLVAARNFRRNKETHIWRFHYRAQLFQGRGALNKFIRHLTVIKDTRHAEAPVIAIVLSSPLNGYARNRRIVFIISRRRSSGKINGRRGKSLDRANERRENRRDMTATSSPTTRSHRENAGKRVRMGHGEVKRLPARGVDG